MATCLAFGSAWADRPATPPALLPAPTMAPTKGCQLPEVRQLELYGMSTVFAHHARQETCPSAAGPLPRGERLRRIRELKKALHDNPTGEVATGNLFNMAQYALEHGDTFAAVVILHHVLIRSLPNPPLLYVDAFIEAHQANGTVPVLTEQVAQLLNAYPEHPFFKRLAERLISPSLTSEKPGQNRRCKVTGADCPTTDPYLMDAW